MILKEEKKTLVLKEKKFQCFKKILGKMFLMDNLAKLSHNISVYSLFFRTFQAFLVENKIALSEAVGGSSSTPPPLADASAKNAIF